MNLTYSKVHLYFTIPPAIILYGITRPFLDGRTLANIIFLIGCAVTYTTPWDNFLIWTETWNYEGTEVIGKIGLIPYEEYFFFIIQTILVSLMAFLCLRWDLPILSLNESSKFKANWIRWGPIAPLTGITFWSFTNYKGWGTPTFYFSCILGWALPVIAFLWIGAGNSIWKRRKSVLVAVLCPTFYLCLVDWVSIRSGVWTISTKSVTGWNILNHLPVEEATFFLVVNIILVFALCAFDKSFAIIHTFPELFNSSKNQSFKNLFKAFLILETDLDQVTIEDIRLSFNVLKRSSKSFWTASFIFPSGIRQDLGMLYAFCRVTDNMADSALTYEKRKQKLALVRKFLNCIFDDKATKSTPNKYSLSATLSSEPNVDWKKLESELNREEIASFKTLSRLSKILPSEPFYELCRGYEWDIDGRVVQNEDELIAYCENVAGSVGVLFTYVILNGGGDGWLKKNITRHLDDQVIVGARSMGVAFQLINISRDIVIDSEDLGRCYIPTEYFLDTKEESVFLKLKDPRSLGDERLRSLSCKMLDISKSFEDKARTTGLHLLPASTRRFVLGTIEVYSMIRSKIQQNKNFQRRTSVPKIIKIYLLIRALYHPNPY